MNKNPERPQDIDNIMLGCFNLEENIQTDINLEREQEIIKEVFK